MGKLRDWAKERSPFLRLEDGESVVATFKDFSFVPNRFDPDTEVAQYLFEVEGEEKTWESGSNAVAMAFDAIAKGTEVTITREGEGNKTKYTILPVGGKKPTKKE